MSQDQNRSSGRSSGVQPGHNPRTSHRTAPSTGDPPPQPEGGTNQTWGSETSRFLWQLNGALPPPPAAPYSDWNMQLPHDAKVKVLTPQGRYVGLQFRSD